VVVPAPVRALSCPATDAGVTLSPVCASSVPPASVGLRGCGVPTITSRYHMYISYVYICIHQSIYIHIYIYIYICICTYVYVRISLPSPATIAGVASSLFRASSPPPAPPASVGYGSGPGAAAAVEWIQGYLAHNPPPLAPYDHHRALDIFLLQGVLLRSRRQRRR